MEISPTSTITIDITMAVIGRLIKVSAIISMFCGCALPKYRCYPEGINENELIFLPGPARIAPCPENVSRSRLRERRPAACQPPGLCGRPELGALATVGAIDLDLTAAEVAGMGDRAQGLRVLPDSLVIPVGQRLSLETVRVLLIGTQGETLGRIRAFQ